VAAGKLEVTQGTAPSTPASGVSALYVNATKQLCSKDDGGLEVSDPVVRENEIRAVRPQLASGSSAAPTGNVSTTAKMMGLAIAITPQVTGRLRVIIAGMVLNSTLAGDGTNITGKYGTGAAPANGAASAGSAVGIQQHFIASTVAGQQGFTVLGVITGLALNVAVWLDLELIAVTGGGSTVKDVQWVVEEV
jgi:hypothetical protein